jgi:hypothetical protein
MTRRSRYTLLLLALLLTVSAAHTAGAQDRYGPPFEFGIGLTGFLPQSNPEWTGDRYGGMGISGAIRIFAGLGLTGGIQYLFGTSPQPDKIPYNDEFELLTENSTDYETRWFGVRYVLPMDVVGIEYKSIHSVMIGGGVSTTHFGQHIERWKQNGIEVEADTNNIRTATAEGYYVMAAARWKFLTNETIETGSWLGSYGVDAGVRYNRYTDVKNRGSLLEEPSDGFGSLQVFVIGFMKVNFLF